VRDNNPALHYIVLRVQKPNRMAEQASHTRIRFSGGHNEKETPVPIPNTAVKLLSADDTWLETARENRSLPELYSSIAQLVEHAAVNRRVVGSSPT
jgi:hypothetical protein